MIIHIPTVLSFLPLLPPHPSRSHRAGGWAPCVTQQLSSLYFTHDSVYVNATLSGPPTHSPSPGSIPANIRYVLPAQLHWILCNPMDCSPLGSSVHGILQVRTLESVAIPFSRGPSWPKDQTWFSWIAGRFLPLNYKGSISIPSLKIGSLISFF